MSAPTPTARQKPSGFKEPDGLKTFYTLANKPSIQMWEESADPPGIDGGEMIPTTSMHNDEVRTFHPRKLKTIGPTVTVTGFYDPDIWSDVYSQINVNQVVTCTHPDGSTTAAFGALIKWVPASNKEGEAPKATATIGFTNWDDTDNTEQKPVFTPAAGT